MNNIDLLQSANQAFDAGDNQQGLILLKQLNANNAGNAETWYRQAIIEEQIGSWAAAGEAYFKCIELAPHISSGYLYAAYWLEKNGDIDAAAAVYSLCQEADPNLFVISPDTKLTTPKLLRADSGNNLLRTYLSKQHRQYNSKQKSSDRIRNAIWIQTDDSNNRSNTTSFAPNLFFIPELEQKPYYEPKEFDWTENISGNSSLIIDELNNALKNKKVLDQLRPYLSKNFQAPAALESMAGSNEWSALDLYKDGNQNTVVTDLFKNTFELISTIPTYSLDENPFEVFFSLLKPGQEISPHFGQSNHSLTVHLALEVPKDCHLKVDDEKRNWKKGELLIFDDSYLHSAHNQSEHLRIVLIFSIWHPDLSKAEKLSIQNSFKLRQKWMGERRKKLNKLVPS